MGAIINPVVTQALTAYSTSQQHPLNTVVWGADGAMYQYIQASEALSTYGAVAIYGNGTGRLLDTSIAGAAGVLQARTVGWAQTSIASGAYGWVARMGQKLTINVADDCAAGARLFTTTTGGVLDDATVSEGHVVGVQLTTTSSLATAMTAAASCPAFVGFYQNPA